MLPIVNVFGRELGMFAIMATAGILVAGAWACRTTRKRGYDDNKMILILAFGALGAFLGGFGLHGLLRIRYIFELFGQGTQPSFREIVLVLQRTFGGMIFFGGLLGGLLVGFLTAYKLKLPLAEFADIVTPAIPLFHVFGRIGCFLGGCCFGVESRIGLIMHNSLVPAANGVRRLPIQLIESALNFGMFLLLAYLLKKGKFPGRLMVVYIALYSVMRFVLEFWRGDVVRGFILGLSTSQFISIILLIGVVVFVLYGRFVIQEESS